MEVTIDFIYLDNHIAIIKRKIMRHTESDEKTMNNDALKNSELAVRELECPV